MIVVLNEAMTIRNHTNVKEFEFPQSFEFTKIQYRHVPEHILKELAYRNTEEDIKKNKVHVFYFKSYWLIVDANLCHIPLAIGYTYNKI